MPFPPTLLNRILNIAGTRIFVIELERLKDKNTCLRLQKLTREFIYTTPSNWLHWFLGWCFFVVLIWGCFFGTLNSLTTSLSQSYLKPRKNIKGIPSCFFVGLKTIKFFFPSISSLLSATLD